MFESLAALVALVAGAIAAITGFGIGSLLTPLFGVEVGVKTAVAAVSLPHLAGTTLRLWMLRSHVDRRVFWSFGVTSAGGGLLGAALHSFAASSALAIVFGLLLVLAGLAGLTGLMERVRLRRRDAWIAGGLSGLLGGMVGNQGSIRSAAMLGFNVPRHAFVATATAAALFVDAARVPVYLATQWREIASIWPLIAIAAGGVLAGTIAGERLLTRIPEKAFRFSVSALVLLLGIMMLLGWKISGLSRW